MCEAATVVSVAQAGLGIASAANQNRAETEAVGARNRAKLRRAELQDKQYLTDAMLDNAMYKNDMSIADVKFDQVYQSMMDQWIQTDKELDAIFAKGSYKVEEAIRKMYANDYAGTQTGKTAGRLAAKSAREAGYEKSKILHGLMMSEEEAIINKDRYRNDAMGEQWGIYDKVRFAPMHGHSPRRDFELERGPSRASMFLQMGQAAVGAFGTYKSLKAPSISSGGGNRFSGSASWQSGDGWSPIGGGYTRMSTPIDYGAPISPAHNPWSSSNSWTPIGSY